MKNTRKNKIKEGNPKLVIFDFDGTIVDSKTIYYNSINENLKKFGISKKEVDKIIDMGLSLRKILGKLGFSYISRWIIKKRILKQALKHCDEIKKCKDVSEISNISGKKILVSNSLKEFILPVVKHLKLRKYFKEIHGANEFDDKYEFICEYLKKNKINNKDCYYIGDRVSDIEVAREVKCKSIIVSGRCSWDSRKEILSSSPDYVVSNLSDVSKIIN